VGLLCPTTGSYSADGEDEREGYFLALDDLNNGTGVMAKIPSLAGKKGLLGKKIVYKVADTETKPDPAVQRATEFITQNKAIMITGGVSSAVDIALENWPATKSVYMSAPAGRTTRRGRTASVTLPISIGCVHGGTMPQPVLVKAYGKNRKAIYLTPDYSYGHSLTNSMRAVTEKLGWTTVADVVAPFPTSDYSSLLTNIANSNADVFINIEFGNDGISSTKQAAQFGIMKKMQLVIPNISTYLPDGLGRRSCRASTGRKTGTTSSRTATRSRRSSRGLRQALEDPSTLDRAHRIRANGDLGRRRCSCEDVRSGGGHQNARGGEAARAYARPGLLRAAITSRCDRAPSCEARSRAR